MPPGHSKLKILYRTVQIVFCLKKLQQEEIGENFIRLLFKAENMFLIFSPFLMIAFSFSVEIFYRIFVIFKQASSLN